MMSCIGRQGTLPDRGRSTLERGRMTSEGSGCGPPLQMLLDQNRMIQVNLARGFWRGIGDIKEVLLPNSSSVEANSMFYTDKGNRSVLLEEDNFFEDMTSLYKRQKVLFQRSCEQLKDVYKVDITPVIKLNQTSPFGEFEEAGGEELYADVLYTILNMIGKDADRNGQFEMIEHLRKVFHIGPQDHMQIYNQVVNRPKPVVQLSLCLLEARDLVSKQVSGTSNPYCTFYLTSDKKNPLSSSCKPETLNPVWNENYNLELNDLAKDRLHIDVWNFETVPGEGMVDRFRRLSEVKDSRGLKQLISTTVAPPTSDRLIGHVEMGVKELPACGSNAWWRLYKMDGKQRKERGEIHLIQHLYVRRGKLTHQIRLLRALLSYELVRKEATAYTWRDSFCKETLGILNQHAIQSKMSRVDTALTRFLVYSQIHLILPLDCRVFLPILEKLRKPVLANQIPDELVNQFHEMSEKLVENFSTFIRKHRLYMGTNSAKYKVQLEAILEALHILHTMKWRTRNDIVLQVEDALLASVREWFNFVVEKIPSEATCSNTRMKNLTRITHLLLADLQEGKREYHDMFWESLNIDYVEISYKEFDKNLTLITKSLIDQACDDMKPIIFSEEEGTAVKSSLTVGTQLYELYLALQQFYTLGFSVVKHKDAGQDEFTVFHVWFIRAVAKWLDIALYKAMVRIVKAVKLDDLRRVDEMSHHSSSAVDVRTVLSQIRTFWTQLSWPDVETSYVFISRILDDVCRAIIFYADKMCAKAEDEIRILSTSSLSLHCSEEQCLAINNIDYVKTYINPFVSELGIEGILSQLEEQKGGLVADACRKTIRTLMKNSIENVENQIYSILEGLGAKMAPTIERFLFEGQTHCSSDADRRNLLQYLDENLIFLKQRLVAANFERVLSVMWAVSSKSLSDILHKSIEKRKPPQFFVNLYETFKILLNFFYGEKIPPDMNLMSTRRLLELFSAEPDKLIDSFYRERWGEQNSPHNLSFPSGSISVKLQLTGSHLRILVMNCRNLKPFSHLRRSQSGDLPPEYAKFIRNHRLNKSSNNLSSSLGSKVETMRDKVDSWKMSLQEVRVRAHMSANNGMCSPYVTVKLVPGPQGSVSISKVRTGSRSRTLFPIFDETFDLILPPDVRYDQVYVLLSVKDLGPLGDKILLGEAVVPVDQIPRVNENLSLAEVEQAQFPLSLPSSKQLHILTALQSRGSSLSRETRVWLNHQKKRIFT